MNPPTPPEGYRITKYLLGDLLPFNAKYLNKTSLAHFSWQPLSEADSKFADPNNFHYAIPTPLEPASLRDQSAPAGSMLGTSGGEVPATDYVDKLVAETTKALGMKPLEKFEKPTPTPAAEVTVTDSDWKMVAAFRDSAFSGDQLLAECFAHHRVATSALAVKHNEGVLRQQAGIIDDLRAALAAADEYFPPHLLGKGIAVCAKYQTDCISSLMTERDQLRTALAEKTETLELAEATIANLESRVIPTGHVAVKAEELIELYESKLLLSPSTREICRAKVKAIRATQTKEGRPMSEKFEIPSEIPAGAYPDFAPEFRKPTDLEREALRLLNEIRELLEFTKAHYNQLLLVKVESLLTRHGCLTSDNLNTTKK